MKNEIVSVARDKNIVSLKDIARKLGKRTVPIRIIDPQVQHTPWDWKDAISDKPIPPDFFTRQFSYNAKGLRLTLRVNDEYLAVDIKGSFGGSLICSFVNNKVFESSRKLASKSLCKAFGCKVYIFCNHSGDTTLIENPSFQQLVKLLRLSGNESLHIGNGCACLYLQRFACEDVFNILDILCTLLALLPLDGEETFVNFEELPKSLHALVPWIKQWGISDDNDRSVKVGKASSNTLDRLIQAVKPHFNTINDYLDSFKDAGFPEHAILLSALAECASEAQLVLNERISKEA